MKIYGLILLALIIGCTNKDDRANEDVIFEKPALNDSLSFYFPPIFNDTINVIHPDYENFKQKWYSSSLYSLKVPILYNTTDTSTIYRLLWLRSFHAPVCFTIKEYNNSYFLNAKLLDRQPAFYPVIEGNFSPGGDRVFDTIQKADRLAFIIFDTTIQLENKRWVEIESFISSIDFWNSSIRDPREGESTDGSNWIIEGRKNNQYHFIDRRNGNRRIFDFGKYLIQLSGLKIVEEEIY